MERWSHNLHRNAKVDDGVLTWVLVDVSMGGGGGLTDNESTVEAVSFGRIEEEKAVLLDVVIEHCTYVHILESG